MDHVEANGGTRFMTTQEIALPSDVAERVTLVEAGENEFQVTGPAGLLAIGARRLSGMMPLVGDIEQLAKGPLPSTTKPDDPLQLRLHLAEIEAREARRLVWWAWLDREPPPMATAGVFWGRPEETVTKWDRRFHELARHVAGWSKDPSTKVGAVLVGVDRRQVALGYNGFPPGIEDTPERLADRASKYRLTQHAERNVLDNARFDAAGGTLYTTFFPCSECAKSIVSRGIARVFTPPPATHEPWASDARFSCELLREGGVDVDVYAPDEQETPR